MEKIIIIQEKLELISAQEFFNMASKDKGSITLYEGEYKLVGEGYEAKGPYSGSEV